MEFNLYSRLILFVILFLGIFWFIIHPTITLEGNNQRSSALSQKSEVLKLRQSSPVQTISSDPIADIPSIVHSPPTAMPTRPVVNLHTVTYASHHGRDDRFCRAVESAVRNDYNLIILGWKVPWKGLAQKLEAAYKYASSIPDHDLMLFTDAFDVLYTDKAQKIVEIFLRRDYKILFAGECGCWPHIVEDSKVCFSGYPKAPTPYRYLNSGTWIGIAKYVRAMLFDVIQAAGNNFLTANDQKLVADMFISQKHPIQLDYYAEIFQSMHSTDPPGLPSCHPFPDLQLTEEGKWLNRRTKSTPAVFHFNGGGKVHHLAMEAKMWYKRREFYRGQSRQQLATASIKVPGYQEGSIAYRDLCLDYLQRLQ